MQLRSLNNKPKGVYFVRSLIYVLHIPGHNRTSDRCSDTQQCRRRYAKMKIAHYCWSPTICSMRTIAHYRRNPTISSKKYSNLQNTKSTPTRQKTLIFWKSRNDVSRPNARGCAPGGKSCLFVVEQIVRSKSTTTTELPKPWRAVSFQVDQ